MAIQDFFKSLKNYNLDFKIKTQYSSAFEGYKTSKITTIVLQMNYILSRIPPSETAQSLRVFSQQSLIIRGR